MMHRRHFLRTSAAAALGASLLRSEAAAAEPVALPPTHERAARARKRRMVMIYDANDVLWNYWDLYGARQPGFDFFRDALFAYVDEPGSQVDGIWWDIGGSPFASPYPSKILPAAVHPLHRIWLGQGIDWVERLIGDTRRRGLEAFWNHRICEVECLPTGGLAKEPLPLKLAHPDWVTPASWWPFGMWNLASPGLRAYHVSVLRELVERYDLDGIQIDYSRHMPCLPVGRQWELRGEVTTFMRQVRLMTLEVAARRGRPLLLAAKVPQTMAGCRIDGFDLHAWSEQNLVDVLTLGSRTMDVDVEGVRAAVGGRIQLQPCFDDHHASNGYRYMPIEGLRGVFANHLQRGADSVATFNWSIGPQATCRSVGSDVGPPSHGVAYREAGAWATLVGKDKFFSVERQGGYPWSDGFFNRNDTAPLPAAFAAQGQPLALVLHVSDPPADRGLLTLRLILFRAERDEVFSVRLNGTPLAEMARDPEWKDAQIPPFGQHPNSGHKGQYQVDPAQRLLRLDYAVPAGAWHQGANQMEVTRVDGGSPGFQPTPQIEKLEGHLRYG